MRRREDGFVAGGHHERVGAMPDLRVTRERRSDLRVAESREPRRRPKEQVQRSGRHGERHRRGRADESRAFEQVAHVRPPLERPCAEAM
jgi:hypothetical protein